MAEAKESSAASAQEEQVSPPAEYYADSFKMDLTIYGAVLKFGLLSGPGKGEQTVAVVRVSPQMMHVIARLLANASNKYDADMGPISLPDTLYAELGLKKDI